MKNEKTIAKSNDVCVKYTKTIKLNNELDIQNVLKKDVFQFINLARQNKAFDGCIHFKLEGKSGRSIDENAEFMTITPNQPKLMNKYSDKVIALINKAKIGYRIELVLYNQL